MAGWNHRQGRQASAQGKQGDAVLPALRAQQESAPAEESRALFQPQATRTIQPRNLSIFRTFSIKMCSIGCPRSKASEKFLTCSSAICMSREIGGSPSVQMYTAFRASPPISIDI